jgi:type III restriction enzyme
VTTESVATIDRLIVNSPYVEPERYWLYDRETRRFTLVQGERRSAGYVVATPGSKSFDDPGVFHELPLVNQIRPRIAAWRDAGWPGATPVTRRLLEHWNDPEERADRRFFFCQLEAVETLIWLTEASAADRQGIEVPSDGGPFDRLCAKMATGSGKTIVMAMVVAWQVLNKAANAQDQNYSKNVLVVAPGLTVKSRLQVLVPDAPGNYYDEFNIVPPALRERLRLGRVVVHNWHHLDWEDEQKITKKRTVDKRGVKSDERYVRDVLGDMATSRNILVINDEAHHAWRLPAGVRVAGVSKAEADEATKWVGGLDRIHSARGIIRCFDFSATPFAPSGKQSSGEALFDWVVSDFGLSDAIESGLVKTPRVVVRDDALPNARTYKSKLYHLYSDPTVRDDLNRKAEAQAPLPDLVVNAYYLLGKDWLEAKRLWQEAGHRTPPVMITVANRTETAARIKYAFDHGKIRIDELARPHLTLHIDSKVLEAAESADEPVALREEEPGGAEVDGDGESAGTGPKLTKKQLAELLRRTVDTVGVIGEPGEQIQNVISVGMLAEGWDAKTVTHIMGLRAFSSQLLCEQVVGRGLRRTSYDVDPESGLFEPEYVNIFGVPFTFLPHEGGDGPPPPPPLRKTQIEPEPERAEHEMTWPDVLKVEHTYRPVLTLDLEAVPVLDLNAAENVTLAELAPTIEGKPDVDRIERVDLEELARKFRMQKIVFETSRDIYEQMGGAWSGPKHELLAQLIRLVEQFLASDRVTITPVLFNQDDLRRRLVLTLSMNRIVQHLWDAIKFENSLELAPVFDTENPVRSTAMMPVWYTSRPCERTAKSHINFCVYDSSWEASESYVFDSSPEVTSWVKNDHLGFEVLYVHRGITRKFRPDFLVRLTSGTMLILEVKGRDSAENRAKRHALAEWVRAVNSHGGFGTWTWDVSFDPADVRDILRRHNTADADFDDDEAKWSAAATYRLVAEEPW